MIRQKSILVATISLILAVSACSSSAVTPTLLPTSTEVSPTELSTVNGGNVIASPTDIQLPFATNVSSDDYCKPPYAAMQVADGNDISEDQIVSELMKIWLRRYANEAAPAFCRIGGYTIDKVYYDPAIVNQPLEPRGDFMRIVDFSIELIQVPNAWMSFAGNIDQGNWMHISHVVSISETSDGYEMEFAYP
jgi:hypothetical protein